MTVFECPFCDYRDSSRKSVEGHISGKSDDAHKGKVGRAYRADLEAEAQPEGLAEKLFGGNQARTESLREEIEELREAIEKVRESAQAGDEDLKGSIRRVRQDVKEIGDRVDGRMDRLEETVETMGRFLESQYNGREIECPSCATKVKFGKSGMHKIIGECPNCGAQPFSINRETAEA